VVYQNADQIVVAGDLSAGNNMPTPFTPSRTLLAGTFLTLSCSILIVSAQDRSVAGSEPNPQTRQDLDQPSPVDIAPEPTDPTERAIRTIRNRLHNDTLPPRNPNCTPAARNRAKNDGCVALPTLEELPESIPSKVTIVDQAPFGPEPILRELPVNWSNTIVVGTVNRIQPYLSEDKRNIYTEYTISVTEVLKDAKGFPLDDNSAIALDRMGGAIRLASGRVLRDVVHGNGAPLIAEHKYVMFLSYDARGVWFRSVKCWELLNGIAVPTEPGDVATAQGRSLFAGMNEASFISAVRDAIKRFPSRP
jgi:hypothetical protein